MLGAGICCGLFPSPGPRLPWGPQAELSGCALHREESPRERPTGCPKHCLVGGQWLSGQGMAPGNLRMARWWCGQDFWSGGHSTCDSTIRGFIRSRERSVWRGEAPGPKRGGRMWLSAPPHSTDCIPVSEPGLTNKCPLC